MSERVDEIVEQKLDDCEQALDYRFRDRELLQTCLTHASVARTRLASNERLEFLGDAVLGLLVCELLYERFPDQPEGELTRMKSSLVSRKTCAQIATRLGLDEHLLMGKGLSERKAAPLSVSAAVFESLLGGVYLDGGLGAAREIVERALLEEIARVSEAGGSRNFKSQLQQRTQRDGGETPAYHLLDEKGPDHSKCFKMAARVNGRTFPAAWGASKKEAEQRAAANALAALAGDPPPYAGE